MNRTLNQILLEGPSVIRSSAIVWPMRIISFVLGTILSILGLGFLIVPPFQFPLVEAILGTDSTVVQPELRDQIEGLMFFLGLLFLGIGVVMFVFSRLAKLVLVRNTFILDVQEWSDANDKAQQKETSPSV